MPIDWNEVTRYGGVPKVGKPAPLAVSAKPVKGPIAAARHKKQLAQARTKAAIREQVRELDGYRCRWPECDTDPETTAGALEVAHRKAAGAGGDPLLSRYHESNLICMCATHHRTGTRSLHSGDLRLEPLTERGMRGPVMCLALERGDTGKWFVAGISEPPKKIAKVGESA